MAELTGDLAMADRAYGHQNKRVRVRYAKPAELLESYRATNVLDGRADMFCPVCDYIETHLDDDIIDVETAIYSHPQWGPSVLCDSIRGARRWNNAESGPHGEWVAKWIQHDCALALVEHHRFEQARGQVEAMLRHPETRLVSPEAAYVLLGYINQGHPNPRKFLERPLIRDKFPDLDIRRFAAPDFDQTA